MTHATHHIRRRRRAIDRLRTLTAGAAVAGIAGTAGFGVLAAATWSGTPGATRAADANSGTSGSAPEPNSGPAGNGTAPGGGGLFGTTPNEGLSPTAPTTIRPVQPGTGRSHATTGGSH